MNSVQGHVPTCRTNILRARHPGVGRSLAAALCLLAANGVGFGGTIAADNADNDPYPASNLQPGDNGGAGFLPWGILEYGSPGARFVTQAIDGDRYSWALRGTCALGRGLPSPLAAGSWRVLAVHEPGNKAFSGFALKTVAQAGLTVGELLRFGTYPGAGYFTGGILVSTNQGTIWSFLDCGWPEGPGGTIEYIVTWSTNGIWWLTVKHLDQGTCARFVGAMSLGPVVMMGIAANGAQLGEGLTFDGFVVESESEDAPLLHIEPGDSHTVVVSWPGPASGWRLEQRPSLPGTGWTAVTQAPQPAFDGWRVVLPATSASMFYRLKR